MDKEEVEPIPQLNGSDEDESENSSSSSEEEDESESGDDSGMERDGEAEPGGDSEEDTEEESEMTREVCTHQERCASTGDCVIFKAKVKEENGRLRSKLKKLRAQQGPLMEKKRALSILRQTINVESKIAQLEQVLSWMYKAKEAMSSNQAAEGREAGKKGQQEQGPSTTDSSPKDVGGQDLY